MEEARAEKSSASNTAAKAGGLAYLAASAGKLFSVLKSAAALKPLLTLVTAFASVFAYSFMLGWEFAAGFVAMLFIHEIGHVIAARRRGFKASAPVFIPFVGALIMMRDMGNRDDEAYVGIGGPLVGGLAAVGLLIPVALIPHPPVILVSLCYTAIFINAFNLIPVRPLDGGRILQATGTLARYLAAAGVFILPFIFHSFLLMCIWIFALGYVKIPARLRLTLGALIQVVMLALMLGQVWTTPLFDVIFAALIATLINWLNMEVKDRKVRTEDTRPQLPASQRWKWGLSYLGLAAVLLTAMVIAHGYLPQAALH